MHSRIKPWKVLFAVALLAAAGLATAGCGGPSGQSLCDAEAQCRGWSVLQHDQCLHEAEDDEFWAGRTPCGDFLDALRACEEATAFCTACTKSRREIWDGSGSLRESRRTTR